MNLFEKFVLFLSFKAPKPTDYGWFHLMFFALVIIGSIVLSVFFRKVNDKTFRKIVFVFWLTIVLFEIVKELVYSFSAETGEWDYQWYIFPFQFCSTPFYLLPFIIFMKDCKIRDAVIIFISTFSLFAGICVFCAPGDVFNTSSLAVQIQTMVHHGTQVVLGVYGASYYIKKFTLKNFLFSVITFAILVLIAMVLNLIMYRVIDETFNMFYISPYFGCHLPILSIIYSAVPYVIFLMVYVFGFSLCAFIVYGAILGIKKLIQKLTKKAG